MNNRTVQQYLQQAAKDIEAAGSQSPRLDAELLLAHVVEQPREWILAHGSDVLSKQQQTAFMQLIERRVKNEPVAYIIGYQWFRNLRLYVDSRVLIPRPETEFAVEACLSEIHNRRDTHVSVVDVGTGSGAIALAVMDEAPGGQVAVSATDISQEALTVAQKNEQLTGSRGITWYHGSLLEPVKHLAFDIVVSNPPYVSRSEEASLMPDVVNHEPHTALFTPDGQSDSLIKQIIIQSKEVLKPGGLLILETGHDQAQQVSQHLSEQGFIDPNIICDLQGIERVVTARV